MKFLQLNSFLVLILAGICTRDITAMPSYATSLPNGLNIAEKLVHTQAPSLTEFGKAFHAVSRKWTPEFCKKPFPGATEPMTMGEAIGDPCCTWKEGATPDFEVKTCPTGAKADKHECATKGGNTDTTPDTQPTYDPVADPNVKVVDPPKKKNCVRRRLLF